MCFTKCKMVMEGKEREWEWKGEKSLRGIVGEFCHCVGLSSPSKGNWKKKEKKVQFANLKLHIKGTFFSIIIQTSDQLWMTVVENLQQHMLSPANHSLLLGGKD